MSKPELLIAPCTHEAAKYAVEKWHYSKSLPATKRVNFGVWEDGRFIGAIIYSRGASPFLLNRYGLKMNEGCELCRVALNSHTSPVSQIVTVTIKQIKKLFPAMRLIVSFADPEQNHNGTIYQAMNWVYAGSSKGSPKYWHKNHWIHKRSTQGLDRSKMISIEQPDKHRYLYPLDRAMRKQIEPLAQPYPKR